MDPSSISYNQTNDVEKMMVKWNISENQVIFCGHPNHKQCYKAKKSSMLCSIALKQFYGTIIGNRGLMASSLKISARPANKWSNNGHERHAILGLYYMMAFNGLFK